jgi:signal transduction histidine kinase
MPPERVVGMLETCDRQVRQFTRLVNDLLDISRIAAGRLDLRREEVDLAAVVRDVAARFAPELAQAGCPLTVRADAPAVGRWDRLRLDQVATNLLSNALKYGRGQPIAVAVEADDRAARLTVRDQGIGIAPEHQARIFECFERAVTGYEHGGLGLGLYIVRRIVEGLGGSIRVASAPGKGSTFTVELPFHQADAAQEAPP